jgi:hypothetical protein
MIGRIRGTCAVHQAALIDFADRRERTAATSPALAHLEWCRSCEDELAAIVRTIAGLRRLADSVSGAEPGREAWPMLRDRVTRPEPPPWRWRYPLGGLIATAAVALLVMPSIGSSPVRPPTVLDEPAGYRSVDGPLEPLPTRVARSSHVNGAGMYTPTLTLRWPAGGSTPVPRDGGPTRAGREATPTKTTGAPPDSSPRRQGPGQRIDAI